MTRNLRKNPLPTHVLIPKSCGLDADSLVLVEQIRTIDCSRLSNYIGRINDAIQYRIDKALLICVGIEKHRAKKGEMLILSLYPQCEADFRNSEYLLVKKGFQEAETECDFCKNGKGLTFAIVNLDGNGGIVKVEELYRSIFKEYPDIMNVKEVSKALGVSPKIVYRLLNNKTIISLKTGREFRIPKVNLMKYVKIFDPPIYEQPTT